MALRRKSRKHKTTTHKAALHPHHAKPYRKRHLFALGFFTASVLAVAFFGAQNLANNAALRTSAQDAAQSIAAKNTLNTSPIVMRSNLGFELTYDPGMFSVTATSIEKDGKPKTYDYAANTPTRDYSLVQFVPADTSNQYDKSALTVYTPQDKTVAQADLAGVAQSYADRSDATFNVITSKTETVTINGQSYQKITYDSVPKARAGKTNLATVRSVIYVGILGNKKPIILKISDVTDTISPLSKYEEVVGSLKQTGAVAAAASFDRQVLMTAADIVTKRSGKLSLASANAFTDRAEAATLPDASSRVTNEYTPAVTKIYHLNCGSITYQGQPLLRDGCLGVTGTGFFVSADGYIATNGHVVSTTAKDIVAYSLSEEVLRRIFEIEGYSPAEIDELINTVLSDPTAAAAVLAAIYKLPEGYLKINNQLDVYLATLGKDAPDTKSFLRSRSYSDTSTIKNAKLIGYDYDSADLVSTKFTHSDVALLKLDGKDFPVTTLGSIDGVSKGSKLTVIGFPGIADQGGGLTDATKIEATATTGTVSAIRDSNDGKRKLIQSDVKISHGNSGGPVFDETGKVFGLATYVLTGENGDSNYSYMRDIKDLKDLARDKGVTFDTNSATQKAWSAGLDSFYKAHYTAAINKFKEAQKLYPSLALADDLIKTAQTKIANGEEVPEPIWSFLLWGVGILSLGGAVVMVVIISKHRVKHAVYTATNAGQTPLAAAVPAMAGAPAAAPATGFSAPKVAMGPMPPTAVQPQMQQPVAPQQPPAQPPVQPQPPQGPTPPQNPPTMPV